MEVNKKEGSISYVLVVDEKQMGRPTYYAGYFQDSYIKNTNEYTEAMKMPFKDEAQCLCDLINKEITGVKYHVEEHGYM